MEDIFNVHAYEDGFYDGLRKAKDILEEEGYLKLCEAIEKQSSIIVEHRLELMDQLKILDRENFGKALKNKRIEKRIGQRELARMIGVGDSHVSKWEHGICKPNKKTLIKLYEIFGEF